MMKVEVPSFTRSRFSRRWNMMDEDRVKWYNWNLACTALTAVPLLWMYTVSFRTCAETETLMRISVSVSAQVLKLTVYIHSSGTAVRAVHARFQLYHFTRSSSIMFHRREKRLLVKEGTSTFII